ncbi:MAG TPA: hypothetical protein VK939_09535, partial [Longimicrobiales bacterium]|nr:hypothetical protein [Longimicrobiales bacterium]
MGKVHARLLGNEHYAVLVTDRGGGFSAYRGLAITRWSPDPLADAAGPACYLRDLDSGRFWRIGMPPSGAGSAHVRSEGAVVRLATEYDGITARLTVAVAAAAPLEVRRVRVENRSGRPRRIELTTYAELVFNTPAADAGHPAFSKLFVQTAHEPDAGALLAWRRLRSPDDVRLHVAQRLVTAAPVEHETDRMRFIGRGRSLAAPAALVCRTPLSGTTGNVLDPVFAQRAA